MMKSKWVFAWAGLWAIGLSGAGEAARADFTVYCPNSTLALNWTGSALGEPGKWYTATRVFAAAGVLGGAKVDSLECSADIPVNTVQQVQFTLGPGETCQGGAQLSKLSASGVGAVFKSKVYASDPATSRLHAGVCTLNFPLNPSSASKPKGAYQRLSAKMSKLCTVVNTSGAWRCPTGTVQLY